MRNRFPPCPGCYTTTYLMADYKILTILILIICLSLLHLCVKNLSGSKSGSILYIFLLPTKQCVVLQNLQVVVHIQKSVADQAYQSSSIFNKYVVALAQTHQVLINIKE